MRINIKRLCDNAVVPTYGSPYSAGADRYAAIESAVSVMPGETFLFKTGIAMEIPKGYVGLVFARSGLATKRGLAPANKVGVIDSDYRGEVMVALHNHSSISQVVEPGERIAQISIVPFLSVEFEEVEELSETERASGGFGSTGRK